jgi:hypothetical protein
MSKAQLVITAVVLEGRSKSEVAGADTIAAHLSTDSAVPNVPAVSTIWRVPRRTVNCRNAANSTR